MPSNAISNLNVRLGFLFDERSLKNVERRLQRSGQKLSQLGSAMTVSISAPLALLGIGAIKAAGEFESLELAMQSTFKNAGRSVAEANAELAALRKAAEAPGLDVPQAIAASIRLQSVGQSAESARATIVELANAVASTGGTAQNLEGVTVQFAQMISKGKVLAGDLRIVQENLPIISDLMQKAFGTSNSEAIQKLGISGKEFVTKITAEMGKLSRVEGGITNSIVNAGTAVKVFLASIGNEINKAFNIKEVALSFGKTLESMAAAFAGLSDETKRFIVQAGIALIALGPLVKVFGVLQSTVASSLGVYGSMLKFMRAIPDVVGKAVNAFNALNTASRAFIVIGIAAAVIGIASALGAFNKEATTAEKVQSSINSIQKEAVESISAEKSAVSRLIGVLNDETASREAKEKAISDLKQISPEYFGQLKVENGLVVGLTAAYDGYIKNLLLAAKARKAEARLIEIDQQRTEELEKQKKLQDDLAKSESSKTVRRGGFSANDTGAFDSGQASRGGALAAELNASKKLVEQLAAEEKALTEVSKAGFEAQAQQRASAAVKVAASNDVAGAIGEETKAAKLLKEVLSDIANERSRQDLLGAADIEAEAQVIENGLKRLLDGGFKPTSEAVQNLKNELKGLFDTQKIADFAPLAPPSLPGSVSSDGGGVSAAAPTDVDLSKVKEFLSYSQQLGVINTELQEGVMGFNTAFEQTAKLVGEQGTLMQQVFVGMGAAISDAALSGKSSLGELGQAAAGAAAKIVRAYIQQGVAAAVFKALSSLPFPFNLAAAGAAGGLAAALFTKAIGAIGVKGFAKGTKDAPGGLSLVGEKGPELVNLPRHSQVYTAQQTSAMLNGNSYGGNVNVSGEFRVAGTDLVVVLERAQSKNQRRF